MKGIIKALLFILVLLVVVELSFQARSRYFPPKMRLPVSAEGTRVMVIGDSVTMDEQHGADSWPRILEGLLNANGGPKFTVFNLAQSGADTVQTAERLPRDIESVKPDVVISMIGTNDGIDNGVRPEPPKWYKRLKLYRFYSMFSERFGLDWRRFLLRIRVIDEARADEAQIPFAEFYRQINQVPSAKSPEDARARWDEAKRLLEKERDSNKKITKEILASALVALAGGARQAKLEPQAERAFLDALKVDPKSATAMRLLAWMYFQSGNFHGATEWFEKSIEIDPIDTAIAGLFRSYLKTKATQRGISFFEKEIPRMENKGIAYARLAQLYLIANRRDEADQAFRRSESEIRTRHLLYRARLEYFAHSGQMDKLNELFIQSTPADDGGLSARARESYLKIAQMLREKSIPLIAVQYPSRHVDSLKEVFKDEPADTYVIVDTHGAMIEEIERESRTVADYYTVDLVHLSAEGLRLVASAVAREMSRLNFKTKVVE